MRKPHNVQLLLYPESRATTELFNENIYSISLYTNAKGNIDAKMKQLLTGLDDGLSSQL
jgi:hypothetical protein